MNEKIDFTTKDGKNKFNDVCLYALSTCGHCKRALQYLNDHEIAFKYVFIDLLPFELKNQLKRELREKFNQRIAFPFLVVNNDDCIVGFFEDEYETLITNRI
ncbi:MAG: glutaredoxin family protein [Promethearchaeota archaeon]